MHLCLLTVGKPRDPEAIALHDRYAARIRRFGIGYETASVPETRAGARYSDEHVRRREAEALLARAGGRGTLVALDRRGRALDSRGLARRLERWATPRATLVVGGPLGLHRDAIERAAEAWSLSALTLPHELVRVVVAEQLYRAVTILRGVPYHK